jgi:hypothetical protein
MQDVSGVMGAVSLWAFSRNRPASTSAEADRVGNGMSS